MLRRYTVVAFQVIANVRGERAEERGGGVAFVPVDDRASWPRAIEQLVREHFRNPLGRSVEVGIASLDEDLLAPVCHRGGDVYWQGGDD